ncbi:MAG: DUF2079 domain-containing protein, partial [Clostridium sp.]|nr:DUF2079 domain-containing protein [Clostridium sp.]
GIIAESRLFYVRTYARSHESAALARDLLSEIPQEASVRSSTFFIPQLSGRDEIYMIDSSHSAQYVVIDRRPGYQKDQEDILEDCSQQGYVMLGEVDGYVTVMRAEDE